MQKAIIIGASSGIGKELAILLARDGFTVGAAARRQGMLEELSKELGSALFVKQMDVARPEEALAVFGELVRSMGGLDVLIICAGIGYINPDLLWEHERETIDVNVTGFTAIAGAGMKYFLKQGSGHLVGISSVSALRGSAECPAYNASKAYMSNYLEGLQCLTRKNKAIIVTDIKPGLIDTAMAKGDGLIWVAPLKVAAKQIYEMIKRKRTRGYVTRRWGIIALLFKILPGRVYAALFGGNKKQPN